MTSRMACSASRSAAVTGLSSGLTSTSIAPPKWRIAIASAASAAACAVSMARARSIIKNLLNYAVAGQQRLSDHPSLPTQRAAETHSDLSIGLRLAKPGNLTQQLGALGAGAQPQIHFVALGPQVDITAYLNCTRFGGYHFRPLATAL